MKMTKKNGENMDNVLIVGAGTGGLSVARELSKNPNVNITILEKGPLSEESEAYKYYDVWDKNEMELIKQTLLAVLH